MQIYKGKFKSNGNCGYVLKPDIMCEGLLVYFEFQSSQLVTTIIVILLKCKSLRRVSCYVSNEIPVKKKPPEFKKSVFFFILSTAEPKFDPMTRTDIKGVRRKTCKIKVNRLYHMCEVHYMCFWRMWLNVCRHSRKTLSSPREKDKWSNYNRCVRDYTFMEVDTLKSFDN